MNQRELSSFIWSVADLLRGDYKQATTARSSCRLPDDFVRNFMVALPPLPEQAAIASFLDRETSKFDGLLSEAIKLVAILRERRAALISAAVTGKIDVREMIAADEATP